MRESKFLKDTCENLEKLMAIPSLKVFETEDLSRLVKMSKIRHYSDGEIIIEEGTLDPLLYMLLSGKVKITKSDKQLVSLKRRGDFFGEMGVIAGIDRSASAYALGDTICLATDASQINRIAGKDRLTFAFLLHRVLAEALVDHLRMTNNELVKAKQEITRLKSIAVRNESESTEQPK